MSIDIISLKIPGVIYCELEFLAQYTYVQHYMYCVAPWLIANPHPVIPITTALSDDSISFLHRILTIYAIDEIPVSENIDNTLTNLGRKMRRAMDNKGTIKKDLSIKRVKYANWLIPQPITYSKDDVRMMVNRGKREGAKDMRDGIVDVHLDQGVAILKVLGGSTRSTLFIKRFCRAKAQGMKVSGVCVPSMPSIKAIKQKFECINENARLGVLPIYAGSAECMEMHTTSSRRVKTMSGDVVDQIRVIHVNNIQNIFCNYDTPEECLQFVKSIVTCCGVPFSHQEFVEDGRRLDLLLVLHEDCEFLGADVRDLLKVKFPALDIFWCPPKQLLTARIYSLMHLFKKVLQTVDCDPHDHNTIINLVVGLWIDNKECKARLTARAIETTAQPILWKDGMSRPETVGFWLGHEKDLLFFQHTLSSMLIDLDSQRTGLIGAPIYDEDDETPSFLSSSTI